jgi:RNA polymerase sigma-70 factor, ECF subfamily
MDTHQSVKSDQELVQASLKNADNFAHLIDRYEKQLFVYIKRLIKSSNQEAQDILQEVFIKIYQNLNGFDQSLKFSSWVYRITYNHTISYFRKNKKSLETLSLEDNETIFEKLSSDSDLVHSTEQKIQKSQIKKLLKSLDKKYRDVLILKYLEDKDYSEIANILKKPMGTIATLINRAKAKFKKLLIENNITF